MALLVKWFNSIERHAELFLQMPLAPHALRKTQQQREKNRIGAIPARHDEKWQVDKVVREGVDIPPRPQPEQCIEGKPMIAVRFNRDRPIRKFKRNLSGIARRFVIFITDSRCLRMRFGLA